MQTPQGNVVHASSVIEQKGPWRIRTWVARPLLLRILEEQGGEFGVLARKQRAIGGTGRVLPAQAKPSIHRTLLSTFLCPIMRIC